MSRYKGFFGELLASLWHPPPKFVLRKVIEVGNLVLRNQKQTSEFSFHVIRHTFDLPTTMTSFFSSSVIILKNNLRLERFKMFTTWGSTQEDLHLNSHSRRAVIPDFSLIWNISPGLNVPRTRDLSRALQPATTACSFTRKQSKHLLYIRKMILGQQIRLY